MASQTLLGSFLGYVEDWVGPRLSRDNLKYGDG